MLNRLPDQERDVLVYLCEMIRARPVRGQLDLDRQEIVNAATALQRDETSFRQSVGLLARGDYLKCMDGWPRNLEIDVQPQGYLAYAGDAFPNFTADRKTIVAEILARRTNSRQVAQDLGLPQFEVEIVFLSLMEDKLIRAVTVGQEMHIAWVSPALAEVNRVP